MPTKHDAKKHWILLLQNHVFIYISLFKLQKFYIIYAGMEI